LPLLHKSPQLFVFISCSDPIYLLAVFLLKDFSQEFFFTILTPFFIDLFDKQASLKKFICSLDNKL